MSDKTFEQDIAESKAALTAIPGYQSLPDKKITVKGAQTIVLNGILPIDATTSAQNSQLIVKKGTKVYVVTATTAQKDWKLYKAVFNKVFKSFKLF